jgi:DNA replication and repair protein RecF
MLKSLELENFRNYRRLRLDFQQAAGLTYLIGDNGQGKTNILEAIYMMALTKSFRGAGEDNLIKWGEDYGRIKGSFGEDGAAEAILAARRGGLDYVDRTSRRSEAPGADMEIFLGRPPQPKRIFKVNNVKSSSINFIGRVKAVFFHPEDLNMLYLGPDLRRRYLDILILQESRPYFAAIRKFKRVKEQRNALLNGIREGAAAAIIAARRESPATLEVWDAQLIKEGALIWRERAETIAFINDRLADKYAEIAQEKVSLRVNYKNSLGLDFGALGLVSNLEEVYAEELLRSRGRDLASGHTQVGPHRDDLEFILEGRPIDQHASRGEYRTILLALKLIEMEFFSREGGRPILLLDDVFSELDHQRQKFLLEKVSAFQTFITTTKDSAIINQEKLLAGDFVEVAEGKAERV